MDCSEAWKRLWPANIRAADAEVEAALEHAETCSACRVMLEQDRRMAELIRATVPRVCAPRGLRQRLRAELARETLAPGREQSRGSSRRRWRRIAVAGTVALLVGFAGYRLATLATGDSAAKSFADDYLRRRGEPEEPWSDDRSEIAFFFARELGQAMPPPEIPGFELRRVAICWIDGRRGAAVDYRNRQRQLTYYVIPDVKAEGERPLIRGSKQNPPMPSVPRIGRRRGLGVATWLDSRHQHALVGDFSSRDLQRFAVVFIDATEVP